MKRIFSTQNPSANGKSILLGAMLLVLSFGCSIDQDTTLVDPNLNQVEKSFHLELSKSLKNPDFLKAFNSAFSNPNSKIQGMGNGIMVMTNPGGNGWFLPLDKDGDGFYDHLVEFGYASGEGSIKILPNGKGQFYANTKNASVSVLDFGWNTVYSNICEENGGSLLAKVTGEFELFDFSESGGPIIYFITEPQTAEVWSLKPTEITNALEGYIYDEFWNSTPICGEPTEFKTISAKVTFVDNNKNPKLDFNIKLD